MPFKDPNKKKEYQTKWHKDNDRRIGRARRTKRLKIMDRIKLEEGCQHCGFDTHPRALQFHHIDPLTKLFGISSNSHSKTLLIVLKETEKCEVLCANCHSIEEHKLNKDKLVY